jgi:uncharacterized protein YyaL (SSP411 family)
MNKNSNHLIKEKFPFLLRHACNPMEWFPYPYLKGVENKANLY